MKKILAIVLALVMVFFLTSCNDKKTQSELLNSVVEYEAETKSSESAKKENSKVSEISSIDVVSQTDISSNTSKIESSRSASSSVSSSSSQTNDNGLGSNLKKTFSPTVIASRCSHNYNPPTCTSLIPCTICGELLTGLYQGEKIGYGHFYKDKKCVNCGFEFNGSVELSGDFFTVNQPITVDINLMTSEQEIEIYPCVTLYKYVENSWVPYNGMYEIGEFFALEATYGEELVSNGVKYGRWDYMNNLSLKTNPDAIVEKDFVNSRLIRRFQFSIHEVGEYKIEITDGPNDSKKPMTTNHDYIVKTY